MYDAKEIGLDWIGSLENLSNVPKASCSLMDAAGRIKGPSGSTVRAVMEIDETILDSTMGKLSWARRLSPETGVTIDYLVKRPSSQRHTKQEAVIQWLTHKALSSFHLGAHCPNVADIFTRGKEIWFSMEPVYKAPVLNNYLKTVATWNRKHTVNGPLLLKIVAQVALCCLVLHNTIGFNHRDLKPDNLLIKLDSVKPHILKWKGHEVTVSSSPTTVLVDFGFACLGPGKVPWIQAGDDVLSSFDACPRVGRDIFMLLAFLLWRKDVQDSLTDEYLDYMRSSLRLSAERWSQMVQLNTNPIEWIYTLITERGFQCPALDPLVWLQSCASKFPEIVSIRSHEGS